MRKYEQVISYDSTKILEGLRYANDIVGVTLGPGGRNVLINENYDDIRITKDGITVLNSLEHGDRLVNIGIIAAKRASQATVDECGDATTSTCLLCYEIYKEGLHAIERGGNVIGIKRELDNLLIEIEKVLKEKTRFIETYDDLYFTAFCSTNGDSFLSELIAGELHSNKDTYIEVRKSAGNTYMERSDGLHIPRGYISHGFLRTGEIGIEMEKPYILITDQKISNSNIILPLLQELVSIHGSIKNIPGLLIICEDMDSEALATLVLNVQNSGLRVCAIKSPDFGVSGYERLVDISYFTGSKVFSKMRSDLLHEARVSMLGRADKIIINKESCIIKPPRELFNKEFIESIDILKTERLSFIRSLIKEEELSNIDGSLYRLNKLKSRLSNLEKGISTLYISGGNDDDIKERIDRVDDALGAVRSAIKGGILPGGYATHVYLSKWLKSIRKQGIAERDIAIDILSRSLLSPLRKLLENGCEKPQLIYEKVINSRYGYSYDLRKRKVGDMLKFGVIDPLPVIYSSIKNAISMAGILLTTSGIISYKANNEPILND